MYQEKAKELIRRIHAAGVDYEVWLQLEAEVADLFATIPKDQYDIIDEMFIEDGAGEMLYMVCDGIRYEKNKKDMVYRVIAQKKIHQYVLLTLDQDVFKAPNTPCLINGNPYSLVYYHETPMPGVKPSHNKIAIEGDGDFLDAIVVFKN